MTEKYIGAVTVPAAPIHPRLIERYEAELAALTPWEREALERLNFKLERAFLFGEEDDG